MSVSSYLLSAAAVGAPAAIVFLIMWHVASGPYRREKKAHAETRRKLAVAEQRRRA